MAHTANAQQEALGVEQFCEDLERKAQAALTVVTRLEKLLKDFKEATNVGNLQLIFETTGKILDQAQQIIAKAEAIHDTANSSRAQVIAYLQSQYFDDLRIAASSDNNVRIATLKAEGVPGKSLTYAERPPSSPTSLRNEQPPKTSNFSEIPAPPAELKILPGKLRLSCGGHEFGELRSREALKRIASIVAKPPTPPTKFLEALYEQYRAFAEGSFRNEAIPLKKIYDALTVFPSDTRKRYTREHFQRDIATLAALIHKRPVFTSTGEQVELPSVSTGSESPKDVYTVLLPGGHLESYKRIKFHKTKEPGT